MIQLLAEMTDRKPRPSGDTAYIDERDRLAILARMDEKGVNRKDIADACGVTKSAITLLLSRPIPKGKRRGCKFLAKLQAKLELEVTARRPAVVPREDWRRAERIVEALKDDPEGLAQWLASGEWAAGRVKVG